MYPRTNYEMTDEQLDNLMKACKFVACMMVGSSPPSSPQENANIAWATLGLKMGFDPLTVQPRQGFSTKYFTAIPSETEIQKGERLAKEEAKKDFDELVELNALLATTKNRISELQQKSELTLINN